RWTLSGFAGRGLSYFADREPFERFVIMFENLYVHPAVDRNGFAKPERIEHRLAKNVRKLGRPMFPTAIDKFLYRTRHELAIIKTLDRRGLAQHASPVCEYLFSAMFFDRAKELDEVLLRLLQREGPGYFDIHRSRTRGKFDIQAHGVASPILN